ncbi:MAG: four helix bundle protein [Phycisphaerales bacterium]
MAEAIQSYRDLEAWRLAIRLTKVVYRMSEHFPNDERFGLTSQIRRAAVSIASNIAEGWGRGSTSDYARFLRMARGSMYEVETQGLIALELGFVDKDKFDFFEQSIDEAGRVLAGLIRSIESKL